MLAFLVDTPTGFLCRKVAGRACLAFPEEVDEFNTIETTKRWKRPVASQYSQKTAQRGGQNGLPQSQQEAEQRQSSSNQLIIVDWYDELDPSNPENWSSWKKFRVHFIIDYVSVAIYMSASIYSASQSEVSRTFGVSAMVSSLGLALYVLGYGIGPMFFSPPSELPSVGRNIPYLVSISVFMIISIPTALADNIGSLLLLRFLQGFFGSPVLATGGASLSDVSSPTTKPYALFGFAMFCLAGPALGTIIAGFSVPVLGWRWSLWEVMLVNGPGLILLLFLPETSHANILHRRAERLQSLDTNGVYKSKFECGEDQTSIYGRLYNSLVVPWRLNLMDPSIAFTSLYCGLVYAIYYSFFEFFPLVYGNLYGMSLGETGLMFLSVLVAVGFAFIPYAAFIRHVRVIEKRGCSISPEGRLLPAMLASLLIPSGIFIFAWTARPNIHWIVPTIGTMLVSGNVVVVIQSIYVYITSTYPESAASLFSGNGLVRGVVAFAGVLWSHPLYDNLGVEWGMTVMGCCCVLCVVGIFVLYFFGPYLRSRSTFT